MTKFKMKFLCAVAVAQNSFHTFGNIAYLQSAKFL